MNTRKTRKGGLLTPIKKGIWGSKSPVYKMDVTESVSFDKDRYELSGVISETVDEFAFFRAQSYVDQYLKKHIIDKALGKYPGTVKIIGYNVLHIKGRSTLTTSRFCTTHINGKHSTCSVSCPSASIPGRYYLYGIALRLNRKSLNTNTKTRTRTKTRSRPKSQSVHN